MQRPKKINIRATDGQYYTMMIKPNEDLRLDARLVEFNRLVNALLQKDSAARKRNLYIRTYSVVPIAENCGLIEWVPNMKPMRHILCNLYREVGSAYTPTEARDKAIATKNKKLEVKRDVFVNHFVKDHPPVLRLWFERSFHDPGAWYSARTKYIRTCAVMSMVGFVLGLG